MSLPDPRTAAHVRPCRRVVVTGAAGFIGSHLTEALLANGYTVIGVDRRMPAADAIAAENLMRCLGQSGFTFVPADLATCPLEPLLLDAEVVFHLAAVPGVRPSWGVEFPDYVACNIIATQRLIESCVRMWVPRLVVASSSSVYGAAGSQPCAEDIPTRPISPYGVTKLAAEQLCLAYAARPEPVTTVVALRYFTVYGPRQRPDMLISRALHAALGGGALPVYGDGTQRRDFTYVDDAVAATLAAATAPATAEVVNVGGGTNASLAEVLDTISHLTGNPVPTVYAPPQDGDVPATLADPTKARTLLGWQPRFDLTTGLARHLAWMSTPASCAQLPVTSLPLRHSPATAEH